MDWNLDPIRVAKAVATFLVVAILIPLVTAGTALASIVYLPLPAPPLPTPKPGIESRITRIYDVAGKEIGLLRKFDTSIPVEAKDIPDVLKQAVVAVEDKRFYSHGGIDPMGALRALWADVRGRAVVQGGSTITQQYVKNVYTSGERTLARKIREAVLASQLDRKVTKDEILYRYLSNIYLGGGAYGIGAAAESYFKKPVNNLNASESAMLAGLISAPSDFEPRSNPNQAEINRVFVLDEMLAQNRLDPVRHAEAVGQKLFFPTAEEPTPSGPATIVHPLELQSASQPYYVDYVRRYLSAKYGPDIVYRGGLRVETALDPKLQTLAEESVKKALGGTSPPLEMALVTVEPNTGYVRAMVGGRDFAKSQVNLALGNCPEGYVTPNDGSPPCLSGGGTGRQPGSAFKPITLAKAYEEGIGPGRIYSGPGQYTYPNCRGTGCTVGNVESGSYGSISLKQATAFSVNTVYAQLVLDVGVKDTAEMAHRLGITMVDAEGNQPNDGEPYGPSLTLGAAEVSPLDMAAAYSVFATRGVQHPATPIVKVTDANGKVLEDNTKRPGKRVLTEAVADNVTDALKGVVNGGTGTRADIGRPEGTAGKTGSTENNADAWFVGFTPALSTAVWMGYSDSNTKSLRNIKGTSIVYGGTIPASTWKDYMGQALKNAPAADFPKPAALSGDLGAGARRAPEDLRPQNVEPIYVDPPVTLIPEPTTTIVRPPVTTVPPLIGLLTTTTRPRPTTTVPATPPTTRRFP
ncbi:MAG: Multimodular transpeptidase-transglycosylase [uncultured Acidimicrobiales bacterium]|uniref:Multimodular transpeptidase-transglycosylase n=1 Tax=uncultured Acidimicrobiales bacterium TaxID=310071 RepID=A0A6J4HNL4_9ACTN|nr:MAG: Multimodular transpeptidase-transglycosylase [uncultured Acidimicrobiales bacterium]